MGVFATGQMVRTGPWLVSRDGNATATVQVDQMGDSIEIGVVGKGYKPIWGRFMSFSDHAWCYSNMYDYAEQEVVGNIRHRGQKVQLGLPRLCTGPVVTVTLNGDIVTF